MQNTRTNDLVLGKDLDEIRERVPVEDRGPTFKVGEIVPIKGYGYRVTGIKRNRLFFKPHGPLGGQDEQR